MTTLMDDLVGLNATWMRDQPLLEDHAHAERLAREAADYSLSIAGARHSQGGHTAIDEGRMLMTMPGLNGIGALHSAPPGSAWVGLLDVDAGATWEEIHRVLGPRGMAPMVQQSSPHFTVGGSLSVNCHGRDPRWGPVSSSVEELTVLTGRGDVVTASRTVEAGLFGAVLGGYGGCGLILRARLRVVPNRLLFNRGDVRTRSVAKYVQAASQLPREPNVHLHFAWLSCLAGEFFEKCLIAAFADDPANGDVTQSVFKEDEWGEGEILRAGWAAARKSPAMRQRVWEQLVQRHTVGDVKGTGAKGEWEKRIDWLRATVGFTMYRGTSSADILQEYFVPLSELPGFLPRLADVLRGCALLNVLSATLRVVRADDETLLSYCPGQTHACVAVDAEATTVGAGARRELHGDVHRAFERAVGLALEHGGRYYLPYARLGDPALFRRAYPRHAQMQAAIDTWNPARGDRHRYWNRFLAQHFV